MANENLDEASTRFRPEISRPTPSFRGINPVPGQEPPPETGKQLIVGRDIVLNGEIAACDKLVVEGRVEAKLANSRAIEVAESGVFRGSAEIEDAEISGEFDGTLTVRGLLTVRATGRVSGDIRYGRISIETGGEIAGTVEVLGAESPRIPAIAAGEG